MIVKATASDASVIAKLAIKMWDSHTIEELVAELNKLLTNKEAVVFICTKNESAIGFAQCQLRHDYVEGTDASPVAYLEGVFIEEEYRNLGYGKALIDSCVQWAKEKGCTELASDCELDNQQSSIFHLHSGFKEANRIICFVRKI